MQIVYKDLSWLKPYKNNPRKNEEAVEPVANSIKEFGFKVPTVATSDGEIINGHTRFKASKMLGLDEVPVIIADDLDEEQIRAFRLADNKVGEIAEWDLEALYSELSEIDMDMSQFMFEKPDMSVDDIVEDEDLGLEDGKSEDDTGNVEPGQIWKLGNHRLMCGDSTSLEDMAKLVGDEVIDLYVTDPPYNVAYEGKTEEAMTIANDSMDDAAFRAFLVDAFDTANRHRAIILEWNWILNLYIERLNAGKKRLEKLPNLLNKRG